MASNEHHDLITIRLYYDFASTLCYVAHCVLSEVETQIAELGVELEWRPLDLTAIVPWNRGDSFAPEVRTTVRNTALTLGIDAEMPDPWLDSRPASQIALSTPSRQTEARWRRAVFESIFEKERVELTPELIELARELTGAESPLREGADRFDLVEESTRDAILLGVNGVPTLLLDDVLFGGIYDGESMVSVLRQLSEQHREQGQQTVN